MTDTLPKSTLAPRASARVICLAFIFGCFSTGTTMAQAVDPNQPVTPAKEVLELTPFAVNADKDVGYVARDSLAGSRLNTPLRDTAASLSVLTREFLDDIGATSVAEALAWSTNAQVTAGDVLALASSSDDINATFANFPSFRVRGLPATQTRNYFEWSLPTDTYNSDRVEEARGPNSILFGIGSAGGVINTQTKRAILGRNARSATAGISSHGGYRGTVDVNQSFGDKLAVRFNGVYAREGSFRNFIFTRKQMAALALTYQFTTKTTLRADYETGLIRENRGTNQQATDQYTNWVDAGSHLIAAPIPSNQNSANGVSRFGAAARITYFGNTGTLLNMANQYVSTGTDYALDPSVVPYEVSVGGPGDLLRPHFDTVTVALEHQFGRNTFVELAYNHQQYHTFNIQANTASRLMIDPNTTLPGGTPNPNAGKYFIESETWAWNRNLRTDTTHLTIAHELDAGKWGNYRFAGMAEHNWRSAHNSLMFEVWDGRPYNATPENQANVVLRRQYVTLGDWGNFYYENPQEFGLIKGLVDPITGRTLSSTWIPRNANNLRAHPEEQDSVLLSTQARYFKDRLVLGLGYRVDKLHVTTRGTTRDPVTNILTQDYDDAAATKSDYRGNTKTIGAVYHVTPKISLFYNNSDNFSLPGNQLIVPDGHRAVNPEGQGTDFGVAITLFEGKLYARANYFKTDLVNGTNSNYGSTTNNPAIIGDQILNALIEQGAITEAEADTHRVDGTGATFAQLVEGYEFSLTANPTKNWHLLVNFSYTDGFVSNIAPEIQEWAAKEIPYFRTFDQSLVTPNGTIAERIESFEDYNNAQLELVGLALPGNRKYKIKLYTSYSFSEGVLKGLRVGGGYRHESKLPIGQYPDKSLQYGPSFWDSSAMIGYRFAKSPIPWIRRLGLQLNVDNVFNEDEAYVRRRDQATPEKVRRVVVREPRTWRLMANFEF